MLARAPVPGRVWVFAFGSLIWNPAFHFVERRTARVHGFHRQFCLQLRAGRGSPERPGLMLSLESGGSCAGVVYRLGEGTESDRARRPLATRDAHARLSPGLGATRARPTVREPAIAFTVNRHHDRYVPGLDEATVARLARHGGGRPRPLLRLPVRHRRAPAPARHPGSPARGARGARARSARRSLSAPVAGAAGRPGSPHGALAAVISRMRFRVSTGAGRSRTLRVTLPARPASNQRVQEEIVHGTSSQARHRRSDRRRRIRRRLGGSPPAREGLPGPRLRAQGRGRGA